MTAMGDENLSAASICPHMHTSDEGTSWCELAQQTGIAMLENAKKLRDAEARCERMRQDFDIKLGLAEGEAMLWNRRYNELAVAHGQPPIPMSRLDTDTTAGEQG